MIEIGLSRERTVRVRKTLPDGKRVLVPKFDGQDNPITQIVAQEVTRVTRESLDGSFGCDRGRKLVVSLKAGDLLVLRPHKTRQEVSAPFDEIYRWMLQRKANVLHLQKARETKAKRAVKRAARQLKADERRLSSRARLGLD